MKTTKFKETKVGKIPEDWDVKKLAELDFDLCLFGHGHPLTSKASLVVKKFVKDV